MNCKTKLIVLTTILFSSFMLFSCSNDDDNPLTAEEQITFEQLPQQAQLFLEASTNRNSIELITKSSTGYDVSGKDYKIDFDKNGEWKKIKSKNKNPLPEQVLILIPTMITNHIENRYPERGILEIEKKSFGYEVELTGKPEIELEFDHSGLLIGEDEDDDSDNDNGSTNDGSHNNNYSSLPQAAKDFIDTHFKGIGILYAKREGNEYKVGLVDGTRMDFYHSGEIQAIIAVRPGYIPSGAMLPAIHKYIETNFPKRQAIIYIKQSNGYMIELSGYPVAKIFFDRQGNFLRKYPAYI